MKKRALVSGVTGQDGSYLSEFLLDKGYEVTGLVRRSSVSNLERIEHLLSNNDLYLIEGEVSDSFSVYSIIENGGFDEVYNLAAQSHVGTSFEQPLYTFDVNIKGPLNMLDAIKKYSPSTRFYQASTSELFGNNVDDNGFQNELTEFKPQSPYACAKLAAHDLVRIYREAYNIHASAGVLYNHESERRGEKFVTRKITKWLGEFTKWKRLALFDDNDIGLAFSEDYIHDKSSKFPKLRLGNLDASRDWGHAKDYVQAMYLMLQQDTPDDYVISTGETHTVREFLQEAFNEINISDFEPYVVIDPKFYRPAEVEYLCGDCSKAKKVLGWKPEISFKELVQRMVWRDIYGKEKVPQQKGKKAV